MSSRTALASVLRSQDDVVELSNHFQCHDSPSSTIFHYPVQPVSIVLSPKTSRARQNKAARRQSKFRSASAKKYHSPKMGSDSGKKRGKLDYTRSSLACAHCRRRKIRCNTNPEDPNGKCENCARLKRECIFQAVDHPSRNEAGPSSSTGATGAHSTPSPSSSNNSYHAMNPPDSRGYHAHMHPEGPSMYQGTPYYREHGHPSHGTGGTFIPTTTTSDLAVGAFPLSENGYPTYTHHASPWIHGHEMGYPHGHTPVSSPERAGSSFSHYEEMSTGSSAAFSNFSSPNMGMHQSHHFDPNVARPPPHWQTVQVTRPITYPSENMAAYSAPEPTYVGPYPQNQRSASLAAQGVMFPSQTLPSVAFTRAEASNSQPAQATAGAGWYPYTTTANTGTTAAEDEDPVVTSAPPNWPLYRSRSPPPPPPRL